MELSAQNISVLERLRTQPTFIRKIEKESKQKHEKGRGWEKQFCLTFVSIFEMFGLIYGQRISKNVKDNPCYRLKEDRLEHKQRKIYFGLHAYRLYLLCVTKREPSKCTDQHSM